MCRHPKTTQELRHYSSSDADCWDDCLLPRPRGGRRKIPTWYDDLQRGDAYDRSWKDYRTTQWR